MSSSGHWHRPGKGTAQCRCARGVRPNAEGTSLASFAHPPGFPAGKGFARLAQGLFLPPHGGRCPPVGPAHLHCNCKPNDSLSEKKALYPLLSSSNAISMCPRANAKWSALWPACVKEEMDTVMCEGKGKAIPALAPDSAHPMMPRSPPNSQRTPSALDWLQRAVPSRLPKNASNKCIK